MKTLVILLLVVSGGSSAIGQQQSSATVPPEVVVLKFDWSKERVGWQQDPFSGPIENFDEMRVRARNEKRIQDAKRGGSGAELSKAERDARTDAALTAQIHKNTPGRYRFVYRLELRNSGTKEVKSVDWDYVFLDTSTHAEIGRREFSSLAKISPGKTKELKFFLPTPPTKTISVNSLNQKERANLEEMIVIVRVEYSDGSVWQRP